MKTRNLYFFINGVGNIQGVISDSLEKCSKVVKADDHIPFCEIIRVGSVARTNILLQLNKYFDQDTGTFTCTIKEFKREVINCDIDLRDRISYYDMEDYKISRYAG